MSDLHNRILTKKIRVQRLIVELKILSDMYQNQIIICLQHTSVKNLKSVGMTLAKVKEQDGMTVAK